MYQPLAAASDHGGDDDDEEEGGGGEILIKSQFEQGLAKLVYCTHRSWSITGQTFTTGNTAAVSFGDIMLSSNYVKHHHHYWCRIILLEKFGIQQNKKKTTESETTVKCWSNWFGANINFIHQLSFSRLKKMLLIFSMTNKKLFVLYAFVLVIISVTGVTVFMGLADI